MNMLALLAVGLALVDGPPPVEFARDVQPILAKSCLGCHGPTKQKGGLALHTRDLALAGGDEGAVIVPGKPDESRLVRYAARLDPDHPMPPKGAGDPLSAEQVKTLRGWVDQGAPWSEGTASSATAAPEHWSFRPPVRPEPPPVRDRSWPRNAIDAFVLARLEREGLAPSLEADRSTLIRRVSLDLIGLPPTLAERDAFLNDPRPDAYERLVDRLLESPRYGERWARRWLDLARYADTNGYEKDRERSIWPYRDWVIHALNADLPFDQFTIAQVAGDLLPNATESQKVATGFHRNTMTNEEGGIDVEEFRHASVVDRVATTGATWLGLTLQCAQCHTHKYDPITQKEYYRFFALLNNADEPELPLHDPTLEAQAAAVEARAQALEASLASRFPDRDPAAIVWERLLPLTASSETGSPLQVNVDGSVLATGPTPDVDRHELVFETSLENVTAFRLEVLPDPALPGGGPGRAPNGNLVLTEFIALANEQPLAFSSATSDFAQSGFPASQAIDGLANTGWAVDDGSGDLAKPRAATFVLRDRIKAPGNVRVKIRLHQDYGGRHLLGRYRLAKGTDTTDESIPEPERRRILLAKKQAAWEASLRPARWAVASPSALVSEKGATLEVQPDGSTLATGDKPNTDHYRVAIPGAGVAISAVRLEVLPDPSLPGEGPGRAPLFSVGNFLLTDVKLAVEEPGKPPRPIPLRDATADFAEPGRPPAFAIDDQPDTGWSVGGATGRSHAIVFRFDKPVVVSHESQLILGLRQFGIHQMTIGRFRFSTTTDTNPPPASGLPAAVEAAALLPRADRSVDQQALIDHHFLRVSPDLAAANAEIAGTRSAKPRPVTTLVLEERSDAHVRTTRIRRRGEFLSPLEPVEPGVPAVLPGLPSDARPNRLALARWLVALENPLVGRVVMNRAWQAFFGRGLVATLDDFGTRGARPTHPELLDWLATEFPRRGWSQKAMHRLIVTSATYRQDSRCSPELLTRDPRNEMLARGARFRVDAELIRDLALEAAGLLDPTLGGPSVFPPQPDGVTSLAYGSSPWTVSPGRDRFRRGLYTFTKRTAPFAAFTTFDGPTSETTCPRRERSNTPLQALTLLNDPAFLEAARGLAARILREGPPDLEGRVRLAFRLLLSRDPSPEEIRLFTAFHARQQRRIEAGELTTNALSGDHSDKKQVEHATWTTLARALLNLDETITRE
jgi:mono/diheme cytochrome c family protein